MNLRSSDVSLIPITNDLSSCCCFLGLDMPITLFKSCASILWAVLGRIDDSGGSLCLEMGERV
jgi:hypothetical protein